MQMLICFSLILAFCLDNTIQLDVRMESQTTRAGVIQGVVVSSPGTPIANASIYLENMENIRDRAQGIADKDGKFAVSVRPGKWFVHAYKEEVGYPDCHLWFAQAMSERAWRVVDVQSGQSINVTIELGPKFATLELLIQDEKGAPTDAGLWFISQGAGTEEQRTTRTGHDISGFKRYLIPPNKPFKFSVHKEGYATWYSKVEKGEEWTRLKSGEVISMTAKLKRSR
jgi:hypothetical protein